MPRIQTMNRYGLNGLSDPNNPYSPLVQAHADDLTNLLDGFTAKFAPIASDSNLTAAGKQSARRKLGSETHDKIDDLTASRRRKLDVDLRDLKVPTALPSLPELAKRKGIDTATAFDQLKEIRDAVRKMDPIEAKIALGDAVTNGDLDFVVACVGCHPAVRPSSISDNVASQTVQDWLSKQLPPEATAIHDALRVYTGNAATARKIVTEKTGIHNHDSVQRAAASETEPETV